MDYAKILALDLGKFKSVGCIMDTATREHTFATLETSREALKAWVVTHAGAAVAGALVVFETCDAAGWVHDLLAPLGVAITVERAHIATGMIALVGHAAGNKVCRVRVRAGGCVCLRPSGPPTTMQGVPWPPLRRGASPMAALHPKFGGRGQEE